MKGYEHIQNFWHIAKLTSRKGGPMYHSPYLSRIYYKSFNCSANSFKREVMEMGRDNEQEKPDWLGNLSVNQLESVLDQISPFLCLDRQTHGKRVGRGEQQLSQLPGSKCNEPTKIKAVHPKLFHLFTCFQTDQLLLADTMSF